VSTAEWTGVPLAALLDAAGLGADAVEVLAVGADAGPRPTPTRRARCASRAACRAPTRSGPTRSSRWR
jgi:DMSO/TMAO reductase YedYZ molybdopterin-dependent catalytic subunit